MREREREGGEDECMLHALLCLIWDAHPIVGPDEIHLRMNLITKQVSTCQSCQMRFIRYESHQKGSN